MGLDNNNGFESINLEPSISIPHINGGSRAPINVPQSLSGTSEDEDQEDQDRDDHEEDPSRFFLSGSPKVKSINNTVHNSQSNSMEYERSRNIPGDEFFLNPLKLSGSRVVENLPGYLNNIRSNYNLQSSYLVNSLNDTITFSLNLDQPTNNESPLEFLTNQNKILTTELKNTVAIHERYLANGHSNLNKVRSMIFQNFEQLSENYYSLNELYSRDLGYTQSLFTNFEKWDRRRNKVLDKIASIKSPNNKYGQKLGKLLDQSNEVDSEIVEMEKKLESLRVKKQLINVEIETTSSVLESKSAKYVELYRELETQGNEAITNLLVSSGIPFKDIGYFLKTTPVNVTFMENYNLKNAPPPTTQAPALTNLMGIQPFIPEEMVENGDNRKNDKYVESLKSLKNDKNVESLKSPKNDKNGHTLKLDELNYGHGASAYEKGYERGVVQSSTVKSHFGNIVNNFLNAKPEKSPITVKIDDDQNTISEKLDLEPVVEMLDHKINAINDLALSTSKNSTIFREYSLAWKDILGILKSQEDELLEYVSESIPSPDHLDPALVEFLNSTLEQIKSSISSLNRFHQSLNQEFYTQDNAMFEVLINETRAIISALMLVSGNSDPNFYLSGFKDLGVPEYKLNNLMNYERAPETDKIDQTSPILSPRFAYSLYDTYNESASKFQQSTKFHQSSPNISSPNISSPFLSPNQRTLENPSRKTSPTHNSSFLARTEPNSNKSTYSGKLIGKALKLTKKD